MGHAARWLRTGKQVCHDLMQQNGQAEPRIGTLISRQVPGFADLAVLRRLSHADLVRGNGGRQRGDATLPRDTRIDGAPMANSIKSPRGNTTGARFLLFTRSDTGAMP